MGCGASAPNQRRNAPPPAIDGAPLVAVRSTMGLGEASFERAKNKILTPSFKKLPSVKQKRRNSFQAGEMSMAALRPLAAFPPAHVGFNSNHGHKPAGASAEVINQDRGMISYPLGSDMEQMLLAVYDGHGRKGQVVSEFVCFALVEIIEGDLELLKVRMPPS